MAGSIICACRDRCRQGKEQKSRELHIVLIVGWHRGNLKSLINIDICKPCPSMFILTEKPGKDQIVPVDAIELKEIALSVCVTMNYLNWMNSMRMKRQSECLGFNTGCPWTIYI